MIEKLADHELLIHLASELCKKDHEPGSDNITADENYKYFLINIDAICDRLANGDHEPRPAITFNIPKDNGKERTLSRLTTRDSVIQKALSEVLNESCVPLFSEFSFAYISGRGAEAAVS